MSAYLGLYLQGLVGRVRPYRMADVRASLYAETLEEVTRAEDVTDVLANYHLHERYELWQHVSPEPVVMPAWALDDPRLDAAARWAVAALLDLGPGAHEPRTLAARLTHTTSDEVEVMQRAVGRLIELDYARASGAGHVLVWRPPA